jgi:hypothetical protein
MAEFHFLLNAALILQAIVNILIETSNLILEQIKVDLQMEN